MVTRPLELADAQRSVSLVWHRGYPHPRALEALAEAIVESPPRTVHAQRLPESFG